MPTAARMITALIFAGLAFYTSGVAKTLLPEGTPTGVFTPWAMFLAACSAWRVIGRLIGRGYKTAINTGVYAIGVAMFFVTALFSISEMIKRSMRLQYDGPMEAVVNMFGIALEYGVMFLDPRIGGTLLIGGILSGIIAEWAENKWH
ncbi:TrgA family protein [Litoreibacter sp.]|nr:TrgA family protein [Litoreibacter sp.]